MSPNIALYLLQVFTNIRQGNQWRIRLCCELQISCRLSVSFFSPLSWVLRRLLIYNGKSYKELHETLGNESTESQWMGEESISSRFSSCDYISPWLYHWDYSENQNNRRQDTKTLVITTGWEHLIKPSGNLASSSFPADNAGCQTKGWLIEGSPLSGSGIVGSGREGQWFQVFSVPCLCPASSFSTSLTALRAQFIEGTGTWSLLRDMTVLFLDPTIGLFKQIVSILFIDHLKIFIYFGQDM